MGAVPVLMAAWVASMSTGAPGPEVSHRRWVDGQGVIPLSEAAQDVLLVRGRLDLSGVVRGHLYALDSDVFVRSTAMVLGSITVLGGSLHLEDGAVLPPTVDLQESDFYGPRGQTLSAGRTLALGAGGTEVRMRPSTTSTLGATLTRAVLPFERFAPPSGVDLKALDDWTPGLGLELQPPIPQEDLIVGGFLRLRLVSARVMGSLQRRFTGARGTVTVTAIQLETPSDAEALWERCSPQRLPDSGTRVSVRTGLGEGSHWFFRSHGRYTMLWQRGAWLFAVETKLAPNDVTIVQEQQFNRQVLRALANAIAPRTLEGTEP